MRIERVHNRWLLCGVMLPYTMLQPGQTWAAADGSNHTVQIDRMEHDWVHYSWTADGQTQHHEKMSFAFQCRYCLVIDGPEWPT